jgi:hypothetical protein
LRHSPPFLLWLVALLLVSGILYFIWPYLVAFLAISGGVQLLRLWQRHRSKRK